MRIKTSTLATLGSAVLVTAGLSAHLIWGRAPRSANEALTSTGLGHVETLLAGYRAWEAGYLAGGGDRKVSIPLGWFNGLSTIETRAHGKATLNLIDGTVSVETNGLLREEAYDFWMVANRAASSVLPEAEDAMLRVGTLRQLGTSATLDTTLGGEAFASFDPDLFVITRAGRSPVDDRVLVGTTTLFHRLHRSGRRGQFGMLADAATVKPVSSHAPTLVERLGDWLSPTVQAQIGPNPNPATALEQLITAGRQAFFNETFNGNGRTCGTCHREDNNLTIDPEFIATLPPNDPLFVAEFVPALAANFANPLLMRKFGLILENVDGFGDLANRFVMRGVPHTQALLQNTLNPTPGDGTTVPPNERTGWSGDGAPGTGTLREYLIGAIFQHYPKTLNRSAGVDFRLPTAAELDAVEAFQRSTGRRQDLDLSAMSLKSEVADLGRRVFLNPSPGIGLPNDPTIGAGNCNLCHFNAGAGDFFTAGLTNINFNTNVEQLPSQPADAVGQPNPPDGGFGTGAPPPGVFGIGNGTFNTPVLVEAADTGPFFHNNAISTIEGAVAFYNSDAFNQAPGIGGVLTGNAGLIHLQATEVEAIGAFLRVINSLENVRSSIDLETRAKSATSFAQAQELLRLSISELDDAIDVLDAAALHPLTQQKLLQASGLDTSALAIPDIATRNVLINQAIALKNSAKADMLAGAPAPPANNAPTAMCNDVTVSTDAAACRAPASVNNGSSDPDGDQISLEQSPAGPFGLGATLVSLTVTDPDGASNACEATVTVVDAESPTIACPANITAQCTNGAAVVTPGAATGSDNCSVNLNSPGPASLPLGTTMLTHTVTDGSGNSASCVQQIHVVDTMPPAIAGATPSVASLWPPDGRMVPVTIAPVGLTDACRSGAGAASCVITQVASDEPNDETAPDWQIVPPLTVLLRAERAGRGDGRVYTVTLACTDQANNSSTTTALVSVPLSRRP